MKTAFNPSLPDFLIIGASKCATTSLHAYLNRHPEIQMPTQKELNYFTGKSNWQKGIEWYRSQFQIGPHLNGEASPSYTHYPSMTQVPKRIFDLLPKIKFIYIVRDPLERIKSHFAHRIKLKKPTPPFRDLFYTDLGRDFVAWSKYHMQISQYLNYFDLKQFCFIHLDDLNYHRAETLRSVFSFLEVDPNFWDWHYHVRYHVNRKTAKPLGDIPQPIKDEILEDWRLFRKDFLLR